MARRGDSACVVTLVAAAKGNDDGAVRKALAAIRKAISGKGRFSGNEVIVLKREVVYEFFLMMTHIADGYSAKDSFLGVIHS